MKRSSVLSRSFFRRPAIRDLVPDLKLVLTVMTVGCESHAGVYRPSGLGEDAGLDAAALVGAQADLEHRGHILADQSTGEIMLTAFYRDNTFNGAARLRQWHDDFMQIDSPRLRAAALKSARENPSCGLPEALLSEVKKNQQVRYQGEGEGEGEGKQKAAAAAACAAAASLNSHPPTQPRGCTYVHGIKCWHKEPADRQLVEQLAARHGAAAVEGAADRLRARLGRPPLPSDVDLEFAELEKAAARQHREAQALAQIRAPAARCSNDIGRARIAEIKKKLGGTA